MCTWGQTLLPYSRSVLNCGRSDLSFASSYGPNISIFSNILTLLELIQEVDPIQSYGLTEKT